MAPVSADGALRSILACKVTDSGPIKKADDRSLIEDTGFIRPEKITAHYDEPESCLWKTFADLREESIPR